MIWDRSQEGRHEEEPRAPWWIDPLAALVVLIAFGTIVVLIGGPQ